MLHTPPNSSSINSYKSVEYNLAAIIILLLTEICLVSFSANAIESENRRLLNIFFVNADHILQFAITFFVTFSILISKHFLSLKASIDARLPAQIKLFRFGIHSIIFLVFYATTILAFSEAEKTIFGSVFTFGIWVILAFVVFATALWVIAPLKSWLNLGFRFKRIGIISALAGIVILLISLGSRLLWEPLSYFAIGASYLQLQLIYDPVFLDLGFKHLGAENFIVEIAPQCSGLEGMGLASGITCAYLYVCREQMSFPKAFLLIPIAVILALILNTFRITALIAIGASISEEIALEGFHSVAGWLTSIVIAYLVIFVFSSLSVFQNKQKGIRAEPKAVDDPLAGDSGLSTKILIPFILMMLLTLVFGIFTTGFDYYYPIKILIPLFFLIRYLPDYGIDLKKVNLEPFAIGLAVAIIWIILAAPSTEENEVFLSHIGNMSPFGASLWFLGRVVGFLVLAPVMEELVFRCYLLSRISGRPLLTTGRMEFGAISFIVTSILFGFMHSDWVAGIIAGMFFAICRYRSEGISTPIAAHFFANLVILVYAAVTLNYSLV